MMLVDISGARQALGMEGAASNAGYHQSLYYNDNEATSMRNDFNND